MARSVSCVPQAVACLAALALLPACDDAESPVAAALTASCEARPASGTAPLTVSFLLNVAGAQGPTTVAIAYGDGQSGTSPDAPHTYAAAGGYTASFTVTTSTQSARCSAAVTVSGGAAGGNKPPNAVFIVSPGQVGGRITGKAPFTVSFNMCQTSDPEGDELYFLFDFDGNDVFDFGGITGFHCRSDRTYAVGTWKPEICVHDRNAARVPLHDDVCATYTIDATP